MDFKRIEKISKGWSSYIWKIKTKTGVICVLKEVREKSNRKNLAEREGKFLALANSINIGPKIIEINYEKNYVIMEYIKGHVFFKWVFSSEFESLSKKELYEFIKELFRQCMALDKIGLTHSQLQVGKNIIVTKKIINGKRKFIPTIIDFEKASSTESAHHLSRSEAVKEKNFGQIASFLFYNPNGAIAKKVRNKLNLKL